MPVTSLCQGLCQKIGSDRKATSRIPLYDVAAKSAYRRLDIPQVRRRVEFQT